MLGAAAVAKSSGDFTYEAEEDDTVTIIKYTGPGGDVFRSPTA